MLSSPTPARVRALASVVAGEPEAAVEAAELAVRLSGPGDPEALNHRAYIRALVGAVGEAGVVHSDRDDLAAFGEPCLGTEIEVFGADDERAFGSG